MLCRKLIHTPRRNQSFDRPCGCFDDGDDDVLTMTMTMTMSNTTEEVENPSEKLEMNVCQVLHYCRGGGALLGQMEKPQTP